MDAALPPSGDTAAAGAAAAAKTQSAPRMLLVMTSLRTSAHSIAPLRSISAGGFVSRSPRYLLLLLVIALALPTGVVAVGEGAGQLALPFNLHLVDVRLPGVFRLHMLASGLALVLIPLVVWVR